MRKNEGMTVLYKPVKNLLGAFFRGRDVGGRPEICDVWAISRTLSVIYLIQKKVQGKPPPKKK